MEELHKDLLKLSDEQSKQLDSGLQLQELSEAVMKLSTGKTPGLDGLPAEFYKHFWNLLKDEFLIIVIKNVNCLPVAKEQCYLYYLKKVILGC